MVQKVWLIIAVIHVHTHFDQLPVGFIAQLVKHCTGIAEVIGLNPAQAWIFSGLNFTTAYSVSCDYNYHSDNQSYLHIFLGRSNVTLWLFIYSLVKMVQWQVNVLPTNSLFFFFCPPVALLQHFKLRSFWLPWLLEKYLATKILAKVANWWPTD